MARSRDADGPDGLFVVDKPAGWTSHDVVGRVRRLAGGIWTRSRAWAVKL